MKRTLINIVVTLAAAAAIIAQAPEAKADDAMMHDAALFCRWLDGDRSPAGIARAIHEFEVQRVPRQVAIDTITYALSVICPEFQDDFAYADAYYTEAQYKI